MANAIKKHEGQKFGPQPPFEQMMGFNPMMMNH